MLLKYQALREELLAHVNESGLDVGAVYFIVKDLFSQVEAYYYQELNKERQEQAQAAEAPAVTEEVEE